MNSEAHASSGGTRDNLACELLSLWTWIKCIYFTLDEVKKEKVCFFVLGISVTVIGVINADNSDKSSSIAYNLQYTPPTAVQEPGETRRAD